MRITIVTAYFAPEISPITHLYRDLAEELTALGEVLVNYDISLAQPES